ncbi:MAG: hypothetical protein B7Y99_04720 [Caulobacterales bacterium 32-69-10]|nr:MAG: hypothetical protein B7Y99_04720 [Caulobacterales bacterium 32-69-10]
MNETIVRLIRSTRMWALARGVAVAVSAGVFALAVPATIPHLFVHSVYLLGTAAAVLCAVVAGPFSTLLAAVIVVAGAGRLDRLAGIPPGEQLARSLFFIATAAVSAYGARAMRLYRHRSALALAELAEQKAVLQSILDTGPDAMLVIDGGGVVSSFSPAAEQLFGWTAAEVIGSNVSMLMPAPYQGEHNGYIERYLGTGERQIIGKSREVKGLRKDGTHFPMMLHVGEVRLGDERQFTGFIHDLTALQAAHDRTQDLRAQLTHVWSMNSLGDMAAVLAHELNQPLSAITNYVRGARTIVSRMELEDGDLLEAVDQAGAQAIRAGEIIRRMRSLISTNENDHKLESLASLISEIDFMVNLLARDAGITVRYDLSEGPDDVMVDRIQIQQVVSNLVRNAAEALRDQRVRVIEIKTKRQPGGWRVSVEDSGPGIAPEIADRLFYPLASSKKQGMGLGLSVSRAIVEHHHGELWVEKSRLGGAAFCFNLQG